MREIKFRAWNKKEKKMWSWELMDRSKFFALDSELPDKETWIAVPNHKDIILMQYTGLKDKNGKEIFEGDIIRFYHLGEIIGEKVGIIKYAESHACFYVGTRNKYGVKIAILDALSWYYEERDIEETRVEIIGNIYESPEKCQP